VIIGSSITVLGAMGTDVLRRMVDPRLGDASTTSQPPLVQR
jgi:hypothetical protein